MLEEIVEPLQIWYQDHKRELPWRKDKNPYYIWISEIMLQQTRVEAVKPYFQRFICALPDIRTLAACPEEQLLKLWEGLGYYNRVRNIQKAAVQVMKEYEGRLPQDYEKLKKLPGIGNYTAGAVASIAFDIPVPAVDGNVLRVISRVEENYEDIQKQSVKTRVEKELLAIMPKEDPGGFNQALMELGAMVCVPNGPAKCLQCPISQWCTARMHGTVDQLPVKKKSTARKVDKRTVVVIRDGARVAVRKRSPKGLLAGMYELPNLSGHRNASQVLEWIRECGLEPLRILPMEDARHLFSHVEWDMVGYLVQVAELETCKQQDMIFAEIKDVEERYAVPAAFQAYASGIQMRLGQEKYQRTGGEEL